MRYAPHKSVQTLSSVRLARATRRDHHTMQKGSSASETARRQPARERVGVKCVVGHFKRPDGIVDRIMRSHGAKRCNPRVGTARQEPFNHKPVAVRARLHERGVAAAAAIRVARVRVGLGIEQKCNHSVVAPVTRPVQRRVTAR